MTTHTLKYGTLTVGAYRRVDNRGWIRDDIYTPHDGRTPEPASYFCTGPKDVSAPHDIARGYSAACLCCGLNVPHTVDEHAPNP